uniref:Uncharacterized protein n=1 Tax=Anabas testudineus TaxID=64144 RepID=A0A3Q1JJ66_ANATE
MTCQLTNSCLVVCRFSTGESCSLTAAKTTTVQFVEKHLSHYVLCVSFRVTTVCGKKICMDPDWKFAQAVLRHFENSTAENGSPSAPFNVKKCSKKQ